MEERKINIDREPITSAEIATRKDFQNVLSGANPPITIGVKPPFYKTGWFATTIAGVAIVVTTTLATVMLDSEEIPQETMLTASSVPIDDELSYQEDTPCVNPMIKEQDVKFSSYTLLAEEGGSITHPSGSELTVPKFAFVDADGNEISGEIEIKYREFHDQLDILFSGIPMHYDSAGTTYNFESAGMLEVRGFQNRVPIFIKPEEPLEVSMQSSNSSPTFNIYNLDEEGRKWDYIGKDKIIVQEPEDGLTANLTMEEIMLKPDVIESQEKIEILAIEVDQAIGEQQQANKKVVSWQKREPLQPRKVNPSNYNFDLSVDPAEFPEISVYKNVKFEVSPNDKTFTPEVYNIKWSDAEITEKIKGKTYNLTLRKGSDIRTFEVYPAFEGDNYTAAIQVFQNKFDSYNSQLKIRKQVESEKKAIYDAKLVQWEKAREKQAVLFAQYSNDTKYLGGEENDKAKQRVSTRTKIARVFAIVTFGIWNADCTIPARPSGQKVMASFVDDNLDPILLSNVQLIERSRNAVYNFPNTQFAKLKWDPKENNVIVAVTHSGRVGYCDATYMKSIPKSEKKHTFKLKMLDGRRLSPQELRSQINI
ncbi:MAG: hypothetical protein JKY54_12100 [Flavobacteriales bacterium]|nr:hypothetical protein [Flavobacteriales bacterium]